MKIGIQVSSNLEKRTGVEEYIYQLLLSIHTWITEPIEYLTNFRIIQ